MWVDLDSVSTGANHVLVITGVGISFGSTGCSPVMEWGRNLVLWVLAWKLRQWEPSVRVVWEPGFTESDLDSTSMEADLALGWVKNMGL